jgi:hypothetical protein
MPEKINISELIAHQLYLHRLETGLVNGAVATGLSDTYKAIRAILNDRGIPTTQKQLAALEAAISKAISSNAPWSAVTDELNQVAIYEAGVTGKVVAELAAVAAVSDKKIIDYVNQAFMSLESGGKVKSGIWPQFIQGDINSQISQINEILRTGYAREQTLFEVGKNIRQTFEGVIKRDADTLARTAFSHFTNTSRDAWAASNDDLDLYAHAIFTFDNRISPTCKFLSTQKTVWQQDDPKRPSFPAHFNCRSFYVYLPKGFEPEGTRAAVGGQSGDEAKEAFEKREANLDKRRNNPNMKGQTASQVRYRGRKDSNIFKPGQVRADTDLESWMKSQPSWFIDDNLGVTKGKLFRSGEFRLESFYDATGKPLTLKEIESRHPEKWLKVIG